MIGVLYALVEHDLKRLLAFHSIENIGIILLGLGVGALGISYRQPVVAALGSSAVTGIVFGMLPALRASRLDPVAALRHE